MSIHIKYSIVIQISVFQPARYRVSMGSGVSVDDKIHFVAPETTLAVIDARLGKRRIKALADNIENEPEWLRKWIQLRVGTQKKP